MKKGATKLATAAGGHQLPPLTLGLAASNKRYHHHHHFVVGSSLLEVPRGPAHHHRRRASEQRAHGSCTKVGQLADGVSFAQHTGSFLSAESLRDVDNATTSIRFMIRIFHLPAGCRRARPSTAAERPVNGRRQLESQHRPTGVPTHAPGSLVTLTRAPQGCVCTAVGAVLLAGS